MKLYSSLTSPFARKVLVLAHEVGLRDSLRAIATTPSPAAPDPALTSKNPLGKIPALELDDGTVLYDSRVICEYLDGLHGGPRRVPEAGAERFEVLRVQALADGVLDAGILVRYETVLRPEALRWSDWIRGQCDKVTAGLAELDRAVPSFGTLLDLGQIATLAAVGWVEFRRVLDAHPDGPVDVRARFPRLAAYFDEHRRRPSMQTTEPR